MTTSSPLTIQGLLNDCSRDMDLSVVSGDNLLNRHIPSPELNRPGLAFAGFYEVFAWDRIQIIGNTEMSYLQSLQSHDIRTRLDNTLQFQMPCVIITNGHRALPEMIEIAAHHGIPLLATALPTTRLVGMLSAYLERHFAPVTNVHGNLLDVYGVGVLIMGSSGVGKSECALELIERGHRLVADDQVIVRRLSKDELVGRSSDVLKYHMEIRGLGILNLEMLFGVASVVEEKRVELVTWLEKWREDIEYERLGMDMEHHTIFDVQVPKYIIPVQPGRNISIMIEMAALTQRLKNAGINPAQIMEQNLIKRMSGAAGSVLR